MWKYFTFLSLFWCCACTEQSNTSQEKSQAVELFVRYLDPEQSYRAEAVWLEGDSSLAKSKIFPEGISFARQTLAAQTLNEDFVRHEGSFVSPYLPNASFSFNDQQGSKRKVAPKLQPIGEFSVEMPKDAEGNLTIKAQNSVLSKAEEIVILLTDAKSQSASVIIQGPTRQGDLMVPLPSFGALEPGPAELYLVKRLSGYQKLGDLKVHLVAEWYSKSVQVKLL
jgi:hypothetical protein